ncbi:putative POX domain-containing protein [Helianthus anomalus]
MTWIYSLFSGPSGFSANSRAEDVTNGIDGTGLTVENKNTKLRTQETNFLCAQVDRRYKQYYHQMQIIISSFQVIAEGGVAKTYTSLALETNS